MKKGKRLFAIFAFVMLGLFAFAFASVTKVHAEPTTFDFSTGTNDSDAKTNLWSDDVLTIFQEKGTGNDPIDSISSPRWYVGNIITFTPAENYSITSLTIKCSGSNYFDTNPKWSKGSSTSENLTISWTGSESSAFTLIPAKQTRPVQLTYTYVETVNATSVSIPESLSLNVATTQTLTATIQPSNATNKNITWSSGDATIATVDENGVVTGIAAGTTTITATVTGTTVSASCNVTVNAIAQEFEVFKNIDLQEQLAFHYEYESEIEIVTTPEEENTYYIGNIISNVMYSVSATSMTASSNLSSAIRFNIINNSVDDDGHSLFYIVSGTKYIGQGNSTNTASSTQATATADTQNKYLWYMDNGLIINKNSSRFLGFSDSTYSQVRVYSTQNLDKNEKVQFFATGSDVTFTDKASNENAVTMRIGFTMTKEAYNAIKALDSNATFGVYLNNKEYVACTPVEVNDTTYRFYVAINGITAANYDTVLTAAGYVSANDDVFYTTDVNTYSVKTLAIEYITNHLDDANVLAAKYALTYLAYNA